MSRTRDRVPEGKSTTAEPDRLGRLLRAAGPRPRLTPEALDRLREEVRPTWRREVRRRRWVARWTWSVAAAAAAVAVAVALWAGPWRDGAGEKTVATGSAAVVERRSGAVVVTAPDRGAQPRDVVAGEVLASGSVLETAASSRAALRLESGASLRVDSGSRVVLVSELALRLERGALYVDRDAMAGGRTAPGLAVATPFGQIEEIGTQFEVRLDEQRLVVRVRDGAVNLRAAGRRHRGVAGEELALVEGDLQRRAVDPWDPAYDWTAQIAPSPRLAGRTVDELLAFVARETGLRPRFADPELAAEVGSAALHGDVEGLAPLTVLAVALPAVGLRYEVAGGDLVVDRAAPSAGGPR